MTLPMIVSAIVVFTVTCPKRYNGQHKLVRSSHKKEAALFFDAVSSMQRWQTIFSPNGRYLGVEIPRQGKYDYSI